MVFVSAAPLQYLTLFTFLALLDKFPQFCENKASRVFFFSLPLHRIFFPAAILRANTPTNWDKKTLNVPAGKNCEKYSRHDGGFAEADGGLLSAPIKV